MPGPALLFYRAAATLAAPALVAATAGSARRGGTAGLAERFGRGGARPDGPAIWIHAASLGEATSARRLIERCLADHPTLRILLTVHTVTGRDAAAAWGLARVSVRLAPWDTPGAVARILRRWGPLAHLVVESELWPNRILACHRRGVPVWIAGGRLSERSARHWARAPGAARALLGPVALLSPQDAASGERFRALGAAAAALGPVETLKADLGPAAEPADMARLRARFARGATVLAASTHPGEEAFALDAFVRARRERGDLALILAPRHPRRLGEIEPLAAATGLPHAVRSRGEGPEGAAITVVDTLGELRALYALAGIAFLGGSVTPMGGHTPYEPAAAGCAIAHGPDVSNAAPAYAALAEAGAAIEVRDAAELARAFLTPPKALRAMARAARAALWPGGEPQVPALVSRLIGERIRIAPPDGAGGPGPRGRAAPRAGGPPGS